MLSFRDLVQVINMTFPLMHKTFRYSVDSVKKNYDPEKHIPGFGIDGSKAYLI